MKPSSYNAILSVLTALALILPFTGKVHDGRRKWFKGFTTRGWLLVVTVLVGVIITYLKDTQGEKADQIKEKIAELSKRRDDSIANARINESNVKIVTSVTSALAKYGLKYDSSQKMIQKIVVDSGKHEIKIVQKNYPEVDVQGVEITKSHGDTLRFQLTVSTELASAYNLSFKVYRAAEYLERPLYLAGEALTIPNVQLSPNKEFNFSYSVIGPVTHKRNLMFYFMFVGSYKSSDGKNLKFKNLCQYDVDKKQYGPLLEANYTKVLNFFALNGVNTSFDN